MPRSPLYDTNKTLLDWANFYRSSRWNIIPLYQNSKSPAGVKIKKNGQWVNEWRDLQDRPVTDEEFNQWFTSPESKNVTGIGVITGKMSNITVVDEDAYKKGGLRFTKDSNVKSMTAHGGTHYFFRYNPNIQQRGLQEGVFIEVKNDGGFIVLPPTQIWKDEKKDTIVSYSWFPSVKRIDILQHVDVTDLADYVRSRSATRDLVELIKAPEGLRHNNIRTIALKVLGRFPPTEWSLAKEVIRKFSMDFTPPLPHSEVERVIKDCGEYILKHGSTESKYFSEEIPKPKSLKDIALERIEDRRLETVAPSTGFSDLDFIVKGFVPGHIYTLAGVEGLGKTALACNFSYNVCKQDRPVLYFALEPEVTVADYFASISQRKSFYLLTDDDILNNPENIYVYGKEQCPTLADLVKIVRSTEESYGLIVVDHIGYFIRSTTNPYQEQSNMMKELAALAKEKHCAIIIIAHLRKRLANQAKDQKPTTDDISGSGAFKNDSTDVWLAVRDRKQSDEFGVEDEPTGALIVAKSKSGRKGSVKLTFHYESALISPRTDRDEHEITEQDQQEVTGFPYLPLDEHNI